MRSPKLFAGPQLRRLREGAGQRQAALAKVLGLSPSYLNQIESDQRPLPRDLLRRLCEHFDVGADYFGGGEDLRRLQDLREILADPVFGGTPVDLAEIHTAVRATPDLARRLVLLHRAYTAQRDEVREAVGRRDAAGTAGAPYEEVRDWVQSRQNYFHALDQAAEALFEDKGFSSSGLAEHLVRRLAEKHGLTVVSDPTLLMQGSFWQLDRRSRSLRLAESAAVESRVFWMAHLVGQLECPRLIAGNVRSGRLSSVEARALARVALGNYFAGALMLPYGRFLQAAEEVRFDVERLQARFGSSFEQVCHRLSTLQRPGRGGVPFHFAKTDIAGNILKCSSATRFQFSRLAGSCPLWNVYRAFSTPGQILVQHARTPDGIAYLQIARTVGRGSGFFLDRPRAVAVVLGCEVEHASRTVYASGLDIRNHAAAVPVGPGCRACLRVDCRHRAVPPYGHELDTGTEDRGIVPYRIRGQEPSY